MTEQKKTLTAKVGAYSSIVGGAVHIHDEVEKLADALLAALGASHAE